MGSTCNIVYLDENGNPAASYYDNTHKGNDVALSRYLESMKRVAGARFQKSSKEVKNKIDDLVAESKKDSAESRPSKKKGTKKTVATTQFVKTKNSTFNEIEVAKRSVRNSKMKELIKNSPEDYNLTAKEVKADTYRLKDIPKVQEEVEKWESENTDDFNKSVDSLRDKWKQTANLGTDAHAILEEYGKLVSKAFDKYPDRSDIDFDELKVQVLKSKKAKGNISNYKTLLGEFDVFINKISKGKNLRFEHELYIKDKELGTSGIIDLVVFDEKGNAFIFDYKTREKGKEWQFDYKGAPKMDPPFGDLNDNKHTAGALQTSMYKIMLERKGIRVVDSKIIYLEAELEQYKGKWAYKNFVYKKDVNLPNYRSHLAKHILNKTGVDINEKRVEEPGKINNVKGFLDKLTGGEDIGGISNVDKLIRQKLMRIKKDKDGKEYFRNDITDKPEYYKSLDNADRKKQLIQYYQKLEKSTSRATKDIITYFNDGKPNNTSTDQKTIVKTTQMSNMLRGLDVENYTLDRVSNQPGLEDADNNILVAIHRETGEARLIYVSLGSNRMLENRAVIKDDGTKKYVGKDNLYDGHITKNSISNKYKGVQPLPGDVQSAKLLSMGLVALDLKKRGYITSVESIVDAPSTGYSRSDGTAEVMKTTNMSILLPQLKILNEITGEEKNSYYTDLMSDRGIINDKAFQADFVKYLYEKLKNDYEYISKEDKEEYREAIERRDAGATSNNVLIKELTSLAESISLSLKKTGKDAKDIALDRDYRLVNESILQLASARVSHGHINDMFSAFDMVKITEGINNEAIKSLDLEVRKAKEQFTKRYSIFRREMKKHITALSKEKGDVSTRTGQTLGLFSNMYEVDPNDKSITNEYKSSRADDLFKLKDPKDKSLSKAESDFIIFFNKYIKQGLELSLTKKSFKSIMDDGGYEGKVPLMDASKQTRAESAETLRERASLSISAQLSTSKDTGTQFEESNIKMVNDLANQDSAKRMNMLGMDSEGNFVGDVDRPLETNLDQILSKFFQDSVRASEYQVSLGLYNALTMASYIEDHETFSNSEKLREFLGNFVKLKVYSEHKKESGIIRLADKVQKGASAALFGLSARQFIIEGITTSLGMFSGMMSQSLRGKNKRFSGTDLTWAGAVLSGGKLGNRTLNKTAMLVEAMRSEFGIYYSDPEHQSAANNLESRKRNLAKSSALHFLNTLPMRMAKEQMFLAQMKRKGVMDALDVDKDGNMIYDVTKDERYKSLFDSKGNLIDVDKLRGDEAKKLRAAYNLFVSKSVEDGNIGKDGKPTRAITDSELISMKSYNTSLFGSSDSDAQMMAKIYGMGRLMSTYRTWFIPKINNYWKPGSYSKVRFYDKWIEDASLPEGGYYEQNPEYIEGYLQTVGTLAKQFKSILGEGTKSEVWTSLTPAQRENLQRLLSDLLLLIMSSVLIATVLEAENVKKAIPAGVRNAMIDSTGDLNVIKAALGMADGGAIPVIGVVSRAFSNLGNFTVHLAQGEVKEGASDLSKILGATKIFDL